MNPAVLLMLLALPVIIAALALFGAAVIAFAVWCRIAAVIGRWQARRDPWPPLSDREVASNGRPYCEPIVIAPLLPPDELEERP